MIKQSVATEQPLISVIICVRDGERYIGEALDSVRAQEIPGIEVLIVLDGSSDRSESIARRHSTSPVVVAQQALGFPAAMNRGMSLGRGRFMAFLDCDDVWPNSRLEKMLEVFDRHPDVDGVFGKIVNTDHLLSPLRPPQLVRLMGAMLIKRASAEKIGGLRTDVKHAANIDWTGRAITLGLKFLPLDETVTLRRIHDENMGVRDRLSARIDLLHVIRDYHRRRRR